MYSLRLLTMRSPRTQWTMIPFPPLAMIQINDDFIGNINDRKIKSNAGKNVDIFFSWKKSRVKKNQKLNCPIRCYHCNGGRGGNNICTFLWTSPLSDAVVNENKIPDHRTKSVLKWENEISNTVLKLRIGAVGFFITNN